MAVQRLVLLCLFQLFLHTHAFLTTIRPNPNPKYLPFFCQLLGMNCKTPTDFTFSFSGLCERGGRTDNHSDGWGLAFYQHQGIRTFHDTDAACDSKLAQFIKSYPIQTLNMMAHVRFKTRGAVNLANVHPFSREMWGIQWCFAHNGDCPVFCCSNQSTTILLGDVENVPAVYHPVGDTDSEAVFCAILNALRAKFQKLPSLPVLHEYLERLCADIVAHDRETTILNFLLTCGPNIQWAYSWPGARPGSNVWNGLHYIVREPPFEKAQLRDLDYEVDFRTVTTKNDRVAVIATKPLTLKEVWTEVKRGELIMFDQGLPHKLPEECFQAELQGHGLASRVLERPVLEEDMERFQFTARSEYAGGGI